MYTPTTKQTSSPSVWTGTTYLSLEVVGRMTECCDGKHQADPTEYHVSLPWNTRGETEDVEIAPAVVLADTIADPVIVVHRNPHASPNERSAGLGTHYTSGRASVFRAQASPGLV